MRSQIRWIGYQINNLESVPLPGGRVRLTDKETKEDIDTLYRFLRSSVPCSTLYPALARVVADATGMSTETFLEMIQSARQSERKGGC